MDVQDGVLDRKSQRRETFYIAEVKHRGIASAAGPQQRAIAQFMQIARLLPLVKPVSAHLALV